MNSTERVKILRNLKFPEDFTKNNKLAYKLIEKDNFYYIVGFILSASIDKDSFYAQYFVQPLFIEFPTYVFTLGERIGEHWNKGNVADLQMKLNDFFPQIPNDINDIINYIVKRFGKMDDLFKYQSLAYSYFLNLDYKLAIKELKKVSFKEIEKVPLWKQEELKKISMILNFLEKEEYGEIKQKFTLWQQKTLEAVKITIVDSHY